MNDLIGITLKDKFEITGRLGEGAMGTVFRGKDKESGKEVAIKVMHPGLMQEPGMLTRFRREAAWSGCFENQRHDLVSDHSGGIGAFQVEKRKGWHRKMPTGYWLLLGFS